MSDLGIPRLQAVATQLNSVSKSFCLAKWQQVTLHLFNGNTQSCHHVKSHRIPEGKLAHHPAVLHNTPEKKRARAKMMRGERPSECNYCWKIEDLGQYSDRHYKSAEEWALPALQKARAAGESGDVNPSYVEIAFDNVCNFKCMYCSPAYSSSWQNEIAKHGPYPTSKRFNSFALMRLNRTEPLDAQGLQKYVSAFWQWWPSLLPDLRYLRVTGGEPLLSRDMWKLLSKLQDGGAEELDFAINSNLGSSGVLVQRLVDSVNQLQGRVRRFTVFCSVDSVGIQAEYIRYGLDYDVFIANVERILSGVRWPISLSFMITVNALCLPGLRLLLERIRELRLQYPMHHIGLDTPYLRHPEHLSIEILPKSFGKYFTLALDYMRDHSSGQGAFVPEEIQRLQRVEEFFLGSRLNTWSLARRRRDFFLMFREYDRRRQTDFHHAFPEYADFWRTCASWWNLIKIKTTSLNQSETHRLPI